MQQVGTVVPVLVESQARLGFDGLLCSTGELFDRWCGLLAITIIPAPATVGSSYCR